MAFDIEKWYNDILVTDVIVQFNGIISSERISELLDSIEKELENRNEKAKLKKKVYNVMVEALQNLFHHSEKLPGNQDAENENKFAIFVLGKESETKYSLQCGNFILNRKIKILRDRIEQINYLTLNEVKILYQLILNNNEYSNKGGGGLGLIDIAKRTGNRLEYKFQNYNELYSFFCLKVLITD
jgi:hypothetical protein